MKYPLSNPRARWSRGLLPLLGLATFAFVRLGAAQEYNDAPAAAAAEPAAAVVPNDLQSAGEQPVSDLQPVEPINPAARPLDVPPEAPLPGGALSTGREESATPRRFHYLASLTVREVYDDNINLTRTNRRSDFYTAIEPRITAGFGDLVGRQDNYVSLTYAPSGFIFADHDEDNAVQHVILLEAQYAFPRLTLSLSQDVEILDGANLGSSLAAGTGAGFPQANLDVAGRTNLNIYNTRLNANYSLTGKTFLSAGLGYSVTDYDRLISSSVLTGNAYFNYIYSPKLAIGIGVAGGYDFVDSPSQDQTFEQFNVRASYEVTGKLSATATAGVEVRQINGRGNDEVSPVFEGGLIYQPFDGTTLSLTLSRRILNSATLVSQDFDSTSLIVAGRQRVLQRYYLGVVGGYENADYFSTRDGFSSNRDDDYYFVQPSLDFDVTRFWSVGVYYLYRENDSSLNVFSFYDNQFGLRTTFAF